MKTNRILLFNLFLSLFVMISCGGDPQRPASANGNQDSHAGHDHAGHDHAGHDHAGHNHGNEISVVPKTWGNYIAAEKLEGELPPPCELVSGEFVKSTLGLKMPLELKEGTAPDPKATARACFYRWEDPLFPNAAILVQVMKNPVPDEGYDDWAFFFVDSKKSSGEASMNDPVPKKFEPYNDLGDTGAANDEIKKYYWQVSNKLVFMVAFNMDAPPAKLRAAAKKIGEEVMKNYKS